MGQLHLRNTLADVVSGAAIPLQQNLPAPSRRPSSTYTVKLPTEGSFNHN